MKCAKFLSVIFAVIAALLVVATAVGYVCFHDAPPMLGTSVKDADAAADTLMESLCNADYAAAAEVFYGKPLLQWDADTATELSASLWTAYTDSMTYEFSGPCYSTESGIYRDVTVTALNITALRPKIQDRFQLILAPYLEESKRNRDIFDENGVIRQDVTTKLLHQAVEEILTEENAFVDCEITLELVFKDGQWWVVPTQTLIDVVVGVMP